MRIKKKIEANDEMFEDEDKPAGIGHNHGGIAGQDLRNYIERIEKLEEEKSGIAEDIRDVYAEAKANGFEPKTMRQVIKIRKMAKHEREEQEAMLDTYLHALGMIPDFA